LPVNGFWCWWWRLCRYPSPKPDNGFNSQNKRKAQLNYFQWRLALAATQESHLC
jgi:hypothetical protein